ncbi:MAG: hypothetical protein HY704_06700 [Gemmatimonadetes bacterium]|nr:hypothetical protein [Gemmatimonadota bacterium]
MRVVTRWHSMITRYAGKFVAYLVVVVAVAFLVYRMVRPMNIFVVGEHFERPIPVTTPPQGLRSLSAALCGGCHSAIYQEWADSRHAKAWSDPYFQVDFAFDGSQQICLNCHTPLQNQQEHLVLGFRDRAKFEPILAPNEAFDGALRNEGVTCAVCHVKDGVIIGPYGDTAAAHSTRRDSAMTDGIGACQRCHVVSGNRWDTFYRIPPCGTVAEITEGTAGRIHCTTCHMPGVERPVWNGGQPRSGRRHLWRGGQDPEAVRRALVVRVSVTADGRSRMTASIRLANAGAAHYLPTGTPDRHLTVDVRVTDRDGTVLKARTHTLRRTIMWRPFIVDLWDTRLASGAERTYTFTYRRDSDPPPAELDVEVRYHLLDEARRRRIGYENEEPIAYTVYRWRLQATEEVRDVRLTER